MLMLNEYLGDNRIQNFHLWEYIGYMVGNFFYGDT